MLSQLVSLLFLCDTLIKSKTKIEHITKKKKKNIIDINCILFNINNTILQYNFLCH